MSSIPIIAFLGHIDSDFLARLYLRVSYAVLLIVLDLTKYNRIASHSLLDCCRPIVVYCKICFLGQLACQSRSRKFHETPRCNTRFDCQLVIIYFYLRSYTQSDDNQGDLRAKIIQETLHNVPIPR